MLMLAHIHIHSLTHTHTHTHTLTLTHTHTHPHTHTHFDVLAIHLWISGGFLFPMRGLAGAQRSSFSRYLHLKFSIFLHGDWWCQECNLIYVWSGQTVACIFENMHIMRTGIPKMFYLLTACCIRHGKDKKNVYDYVC